MCQKKNLRFLQQNDAVNKVMFTFSGLIFFFFSEDYIYISLEKVSPKGSRQILLWGSIFFPFVVNSCFFYHNHQYSGSC